MSAAPEVPAPLASGRLPGTARPAHYALSLIVDPAKDRFLGDVTIDLDVPAPTQAIVMHGRELTVSRAEAIVGGQPIPARAELRQAAGGKGSPEELVLTLPRRIPAGKAQVRIAYSAPLGTKLSGLYRVDDGGARYAFTQLQPTDARRMFPCFDEPGFKVPFDLKVTAPKGNLVVANANELERSDAEDGRATTFTFATTPPLPTYLLAIAVGPFEVREGAKEPVPIRLIAGKGKARLGDLALEAAAAHLKILSEYFDRPFPYPKLDLVAVPEFGFGAMENAGLVTFREDLLLLDPAAAPTSARREMAETVAHELAHHWFGDLVTMPWWDDLWLNEGFATWMESKVVDQWRPAMDARLSALRDKGWVMGLDALDASRAVRRPVLTTSDADEAFDGITYTKGASVIAMLERWLGPDAFRSGVRAYLKAHEHGTATSADLFTALSSASGKEVWAVASAFLDQPGVPLVRAELVCEKDKAPRVALSQARFRAHPGASVGAAPAAAPWKIPLCVAYEGAGPASPACGLLEGARLELPLGAGADARRCPRWIYPNADESGYYRFALPEDQLRALAGAARALDVRSRIGLLDDAWALVEGGELGADVLLDLLAGMKGERHRLVVSQLIDVLTAVQDKLVDDGARPAFRAFASSLLTPIARELGWDARRADTDDQRALRREVLAALAAFDDPWLAAEADRRAAAYLKDPRSADLEIASIALSASTRRAGAARYAELDAALARARSLDERRALLAALGSFSDRALLRRALDAQLADHLKLEDLEALLDGATRWPGSREVVLVWLRERVGDLKARLPDFAIAQLAGLLGTLCDAGARAEAARFFGAELRDVEGADRPLAQALEMADLCIDLRSREGARLKKRLGAARQGN